MSRAIRLRRIAQREYDEAVDWYETCQQGLGLRFVVAIRKIFEDIAAHPQSFPVVYPGVREAVLTKWPYVVYYEVHDEHILILAVFHASRDPSVWQERVK